MKEREDSKTKVPSAFSRDISAYIVLRYYISYSRISTYGKSFPPENMGENLKSKFNSV